MKTKIGWAFLPLVAACLAPPGRGMVPTEYASNYFPESAEGTRLKKKHSDLRVVITPPRSAPYEVTTFGPAARSVDIRLVNEGKSPVDIAGFGAVFTAKRNDVEYQCRARDREVVEEHQPSSLSPGESRSFDRDINCLMPMPGRYEIGVYLTFDEGSSIAAADFAESFAFDVLQNPNAPRAYPSRDGLYVVMAGAGVTLPLSSDAWARGDYHVVVAMINDSKKPVEAGTARLTFLTYRGNSTLPCSGAAELLVFPEQLDPGTMSTMSAPVACAPSEEGTYEIVGRLAFGKDDAEIEIGRVALTVTSDPTFFTPGFRSWPTDLMSSVQRSSLSPSTRFAE